MPAKKTATYGGRLDPALRARLDAIHARHSTNDSAVMASLLEAFCDEVERIDAVRFPVSIHMAERRELAAAEGTQADYGDSTGPAKGGAPPHRPDIKDRTPRRRAS